jgi:carbon-monoxide dehydrogenase iron sulfur subunit
MPKATRPKIRFQSRELCGSCLSCVTACALHSVDTISPDSARIRIEFDPFTGDHTARFCRHCDKPICAETCHRGAIIKDQKTEIVSIERALCDGCGQCVDACPFGALFWDPSAEQVIKCDLCGGDPRCVDACKFGVLTYE